MVYQNNGWPSKTLKISPQAAKLQYQSLDNG